MAVVGPYFAGALVARDIGDDGNDADRRFECVMTHDRGAVIAAARTSMARTAPVA